MYLFIKDFFVAMLIWLYFVKCKVMCELFKLFWFFLFFSIIHTRTLIIVFDLENFIVNFPLTDRWSYAKLFSFFLLVLLYIPYFSRICKFFVLKYVGMCINRYSLQSTYICMVQYNSNMLHMYVLYFRTRKKEKKKKIRKVLGIKWRKKKF